MARSPFTLPALRETRPRHIALPGAHVVALSFVLALAGLAGGGLIALKWQERSDLIQQPITRESNRETIASTITNLENEQADLKRGLIDARAQLEKLQATTAQEKDQLGDLTAAINAERITAGLVPLEGPGVIATFQDSTAAVIPQNEDPNNYILHDYMLRDVLNTLWAGGAEAISMNGERILSNSPLYCVGTTVIANATRLSPPYEVHAIGNPDALEAGLRNSPQMRQFNERAQIYDLPVTIQKAAKVPVPAYSGAVALKNAHPADSADDPTPAATPASP
jgi:uncharacterized protein YlxW (UPF0749 family)